MTRIQLITTVIAGPDFLDRLLGGEFFFLADRMNNYPSYPGGAIVRICSFVDLLVAKTIPAMQMT
jgi:hypothetical protein